MKNKANALDRLNSIETVVLPQFKSNLENLAKRNNDSARVINAVVALLGEAAVQQKMNELRVDELRDNSTQMSSVITKALEEKNIEVTDVVGKDSFLVIKNLDKEGKDIYDFNLYSHITQFSHIMEHLEGKKVGDIVDLPSEEKIHILEIYKPSVKEGSEEQPQKEV